MGQKKHSVTEKKRKPKRGSERVKAWIYTAINPLLKSLDVEAVFLSKGNLTWREHSRRPEYILAPSAYLDEDGHVNLDDLVQSEPAIGDSLVRHEKRIDGANQLAGTVYDAVRAHKNFEPTLWAARNEYEHAFPDAAGRLTEDELKKWVPERIVNDIQEVPSHYSDARFWSVARSHFEPFEQWPNVATLRKKKQELAADTDLLIKQLKALRRQLCDEYDVPPAPLT